MQKKQSSARAGVGTAIAAALFGVFFAYSAVNVLVSLIGSGFVHIDHLFGAVVFGLFFALAIRRYKRISKGNTQQVASE